MVLPPIMGTRKMVSLTSLLLIASTLGWGVRVQTPTPPTGS
jgi:NNP family nitrate/nitrite transporter-like MFS transporter